MKNIYEVLREKEFDLAQAQREIEALRIAARLLAEDADAARSDSPPRVTVRPAAGSIKHFP
jgi:hypothetical protein